MSSPTIDDRVVLLIKDQMTRKESVKAHEVRTSLLEKLLPEGDHADEVLSKLEGGRGFWKALADGSDISADRWRKVFERKQRATTDILGAIAKRWPQHAFWVMTGITDAANGHIAPTTATTYPERAHIGDQHSTNYFRASVALNDQLFVEAHLEKIKFDEPIDLIERTKPFSSYWEGAIATAAYAQAGTESYRILVELWHQRETHRARHTKLITQQRPPIKDADPVLGQDPRTAHQSPFYLFYDPKHANQED